MADFTANDIDLTVLFDTVNNRVKVTDNTDYSSFDDMPLTYLSGLGEMLDPVSDIVFQKLSTLSPLIDLAGGDTVSAWYNLPLTNSGEILPGSYPLEYTTSIDVAETGIVVNQITAATGVVKLEGDWRILHIGDDVVFSGSSNVGNNGTKAVTAAVTYDSGLDESTVTFSTTDFTTNENGSSGTVAAIALSRKYQKDFPFTYTGCDEITHTLSFNSSCQDETISFINATVYPSGTSVSVRSQKLYYPIGLTPAPTTDPVVNTSLNVTAITLDVLANGPWTGTLEETIECTQDDGLVVQYTKSTTAYATVACDVDICCFSDCIDELYVKDNEAVECGKTSPYANTVRLLNLAINRYQIHKECGDFNGMVAARADIKTLLKGSGECDCGCTDSDSEVSWVGNSAEKFLGSAGEETVLYFNSTELTDTDFNVTANQGFTIPFDNFDVGDCVEIILDAEFVASTCDLRMENTTTGEDYLSGTTLTTGQFANIRFRLTRTDVDELTLIRRIERLTATPTVAVNITENTFVYDSNEENVINWVPVNVANVIYNNIKVTLIKAVA